MFLYAQLQQIIADYLLLSIKQTLELIAFVLPNSSKAHGYDNTSNKMIKTCDTSLTIPLKIVFEESLKKGIFPKKKKKGNIIPAHKKEDKT